MLLSTTISEHGNHNGKSASHHLRLDHLRSGYLNIGLVSYDSQVFGIVCHFEYPSREVYVREQGLGNNVLFFLANSFIRVLSSDRL